MKRLQNVLLVLWTVALLLFVAFNWQLVQRVVEINYLFIQFEVKLLSWLILLAAVVPVLLRVFSALDVSTYRRRSEKEMHLVKAKAYDGLSGEFSRLGEQLRGNLEGHMKTLVENTVPRESEEAQQATSDAAKSSEAVVPPPEDSKNKSGKSKAGSA